MHYLTFSIFKWLINIYYHISAKCGGYATIPSSAVAAPSATIPSFAVAAPSATIMRFLAIPVRVKIDYTNTLLKNFTFDIIRMLLLKALGVFRRLL
mgnify:CR=1 FL=1